MTGPSPSSLACKGLTLGSRLRDVSFSLTPGRTVALVGPNGAGKSTLLQVLAGLLHGEGQVSWNGQLLSKIPFLLRGRTLAWLPQENPVEFAFPVRDVVAQGRHAWKDEAEAGLRCIHEALEALDIVHLAKRPVTELSGGERRRVFLARALATGAPIQLWDEPTSNQDPRHALEVLNLAERLATQDATVLVSLHDLRQAMRFDQVLVLDQGHLVASGAPAEVLDSELIGRVFHVEARFAKGLSLHLPSA